MTIRKCYKAKTILSKFERKLKNFFWKSRRTKKYARIKEQIDINTKNLMALKSKIIFTKLFKRHESNIIRKYQKNLLIEKIGFTW